MNRNAQYAEGVGQTPTRGQMYAAYLRSTHWEWMRWRVLRRDRFRCQDCDSTSRLQIHHLTYVRLGRELLSDLVTLCSACHHARHMTTAGRAGKQMRVPLERWWKKQQLLDPAVRSQTRSQPDRNDEAEARRRRLDEERQDREKSRCERYATDDDLRELGGRLIA